MNENEEGLKRATEESPQVDMEHKRQKRNDEAPIVEVAASTTPSTLVLDKSQQDTIKELLQSSNVSSVPEVNSEKHEAHLAKSDEETSNMEAEIVSADVAKPVTALSNTHIESGKSNSGTEDASITSEQLLFALTSVPSTETTREEAGQVAAKSAISHQPIVPEISVHPTYTATTSTATTTATVVPPAPAPVPEIKASLPTTSLATEGLGITPATPPPPPPPPQSQSITQKTNPLQTTTIANTNVSSTSIPAKASNSSPSLANATNMTLTNLPDISAALRRLSNANVSASVIEQLSSSPHLPNIGQLNERKGSNTDVSPSEILGNALAAVAANAAAARPLPNNASPKQPSQQTQLQSQQSSQPQNSQATATAIGNLAAITANISNFLHSGGFHRNSFSQEDTQKLAAAVAVARNTQQQQQHPSSSGQQRRKSSMTVVGNAFSNMLDQAILMGRNKSISEGSKPPPKEPKPKLIIKNDLVWKALEGLEEKTLGFQLYSPHLILPNLENSVNGLMEIRVPARFLTFENTRVQKRALWGTDIYTDDSDIVAMAIHCGKYQPQFIEPQVEPGDPFALAVAGKQRESIEAAKRLALCGKKYVHQHAKPDHDLKVTVRVLPTLQHYAGSIRHKLKSREWGKHDGMSLFVDKVEKIKRGDATLKGRSSLKSNMFAYEPYRKQALGTKPLACNDKKGTSPPSVQKGRIKKTPRVMRMFQIRSQMMKHSNF